MTAPQTPLDRAKRVLELAEKAELEFDDGEGREWSVGVQEEGDMHGAFTVVEHDDGHVYEILVQGEDGSGDDIEFAAACSVLAPALAADVTQLTALWERCKPLCQHDPKVADLAQALGLLPAVKEGSDG